MEDIEEKKKRADLYTDLVNFSFFEFAHPYEPGLQERGMMKAFRLLNRPDLAKEFDDLFTKLIDYDFELAKDQEKLDRYKVADFFYTNMGVTN